MNGLENVLYAIMAFFFVQLVYLVWRWISIRLSNRFSKRSSTGAQQHRQAANNNLQLFSFIFFLILLAILISLWRWGWNEMQQSLEVVMVTTTPATAASGTQPASASDLLATALPQASVATSNPIVTASPTATSPGLENTNSSSSTVLAPLFKNKERRIGIVKQNYVILGVVAGILVLLPSFLLVAFAFQRVPRLTKDLQKDLKNLGIFTEEEEQQVLNDQVRAAVTKQLEKIKPDLDDLIQRAVIETILDPDLDLRERQSSLKKLSVEMTKDELRQLFLARNLAMISTEGEMPTFVELLNARFGAWEYILPLIPLSLLILASFIWIFFPGGISQLVMEESLNFNTYINARISTILPMLAGVISAYVFLIYTLVRRSNGSDLTPGTFWEAVRRMIAVIGLGLILTALQPKDPKASAAALILIALFLGLFPTEMLKSIARNGQLLAAAYMQMVLQSTSVEKKVPEVPDYSDRLVARHELYLLDDLSEWDALRLEEANIVGLQGMATADLKQLITWTPFPTSQVLDWVDQAILFLVSGAEPQNSFAAMFRTIGLRRASTLVEECESEVGKQTVLRAAEAVQSKGVFDPLPVAQLAAMRAQSLVNEMQEQVEKVKAKTTADTLDENLMPEIESAVSLVHNAKAAVDQAYEQVKAGGELLKKVFSKEAESLHSMLEAADGKANEVEAVLKGATSGSTIPEALAKALKNLGNQVTGSTASKQLARNLVDELDKTANPLILAPEKAKEFSKKAEAIQEAAQTTKTKVPGSVGEAVVLLNDLTGLAERCQEAILTDSSLEAAKTAVGELVDELKADGADKAVKLLGDDKLKMLEQWTEKGSDKKAKCYSDAEKLVNHAQRILKKAETAEERVRNARSDARISGVPLPLTRDVLETILAGLRANANLKRIQHYLIAENPPEHKAMATRSLI